LNDYGLSAAYVSGQSFEGSILDLWTGRFGIPSELAKRYLSKKDASTKILSSDKSAIIEQYKSAKETYGRSVECQDQARYSKMYLASILEEAHDNVLICDVGYSGTMQSLIENKLNQKYNGIYVALGRRKLCLGRMHGILSDSLLGPVLSDTRTFEMLFNLGSSSTMSYVQDLSGDILPVFDESTLRKSSFLEYIPTAIQESARLMNYDESEVEALLQHVYPARIDNFINNDLNFKDREDFEDFWSGNVKQKYEI
jgi:hypothetical protein